MFLIYIQARVKFLYLGFVTNKKKIVVLFLSLRKNNCDASSEFVSSSIPSWQILIAHAQPFRGARVLAFCLKVPLDSLLVWASSGGSGETARMRRLAWTFAARIGDKYQIRLTRPNFPWKKKKLTRSMNFFSSKFDIKGVGWVTTTCQPHTELTRWYSWQLAVCLTIHGCNGGILLSWGKWKEDLSMVQYMALPSPCLKYWSWGWDFPILHGLAYDGLFSPILFTYFCQNIITT